MRKTFLKVSLFTMLAGVMSVGFVGCKDYDDDIDKLNSEIAKINTAINEINAKINGGAVITDVKSTANGIQITLSNGQTYEITNGKDGKNGTDGTPGSVVTIQNGYWYIDGTNTGLKAQGENGTNGTNGTDGINGSYWAPNAEGTQLEEYVWNTTTKAYEKSGKTVDIAIMQDGIRAIDNGYDVIIYGVAGATEPIRIAKSGALRSLVFQPNFYYGGIEAIGVDTYTFDQVTLAQVNADGNFKTDHPTYGASFTTTPKLTASYALNPSSAKVPSDLKAFSFTVDDKNYISRASSFSPKITSASVNNGILTVTANANGGIKSIADDEKVTVMALNVALGKDTTISSDYAAVYEQAFNGFTIACPKTVFNNTNTDNHWFTTAAAAIASPVAINVKYDGTINIADYVQTHYVKASAPTTCIAWDTNANAKTVNNYGFKYSYELVGYQLGDNKTSQSAHAALNGSILRPQLPKDGKQQPYGAEQNRATIDKQPLVRVVLTDTVNNKIAAVGYIKFNIDEKAQDPIKITREYGFTFGAAYTVACSNPAAHKITWHQFEEVILADLDMTRAQFEDTYKVIESATNVKQYAKKDNAWINRVPYFGAVTYNQDSDDTEGTLTSIIEWQVNATEAYNYFTGASKPTEVSTIICFQKKNDADNLIYVTLTWKPSPININPAATLKGKLAPYWFEAWTGTAYTAGSEVPATAETHANVEVPSATATCKFEYSIGSAWEGAIAGVTNVESVYADFAAGKLTKTYTFVTPDPAKVTGVSGVEYTLSVSADGTKLQATAKNTVTPVTIATINNGSPAATNSVIVYSDNDQAKDVLNYKGAQQLAKGETLTGRIAVTVKNECNMPVFMSDNAYNVRFLRPITINAKDNASLKDALDGGDPLKLADILSFIDWRNIAFTAANKYFDYYGVKSVAVGKFNADGTVTTAADGADIKNYVTSNLANGTLDKVQPLVSLVYKQAATPSLTDLGQLTYSNNGATVGTFNITVPFIVEYKWGYVSVPVTITVNPTIGQ